MNKHIFLLYAVFCFLTDFLVSIIYRYIIPLHTTAYVTSYSNISTYYRLNSIHCLHHNQHNTLSYVIFFKPAGETLSYVIFLGPASEAMQKN